MVAKKSYCAYAYEIIEGRQASEDDVNLGAMTTADSTTPFRSATDATANLPDEVRRKLHFENEIFISVGICLINCILVHNMPHQLHSRSQFQRH